MQSDARFDDPFTQALRIALIPWQQLRCDYGSALQVDHMLRFIDHGRGAVLGFADSRLSLMGVNPLFIAGLAPGSVAVKAAQAIQVVPVDPRFARQPLYIVPVTLFGIALNQAAQ